MEDKPTNGELAIMITHLTHEVRDSNLYVKERLISIETKQDHTNGRVRKLEQYKFALMGAVAIINLIFIPLVITYLTNLISK